MHNHYSSLNYAYKQSTSRIFKTGFNRFLSYLGNRLLPANLRSILLRHYEAFVSDILSRVNGNELDWCRSFVRATFL